VNTSRHRGCIGLADPDMFDRVDRLAAKGNAQSPKREDKTTDVDTDGPGERKRHADLLEQAARERRDGEGDYKLGKDPRVWRFHFCDWVEFRTAFQSVHFRGYAG
jgi:hypothetical protein